MSVGFDENLSLFQLIDSPDPGEMFDRNYAFSLVLQNIWFHILNFFERN